ncbi:MAG: AMP-binding enzyme, partial [Polyangiaceae bacterium]
KLRGYRIELGEIEARLAEHPAVAHAVAVVREFKPGDARLVAYYTLHPGQTVTTTDLRKGLRGSLPEYMIPQAFVELDTLPLTPNAKVDRKALPAPFADVLPDASTVGPRTESERLVAEVWCDLLERRDVGIHDNFFEIGGHSLLVLQAISRIEQRTNVRIGPRAFVVDTLEQLAAQIPARGISATSGRDPDERADAAPGRRRSLLERVKRRLLR